MKKIIRMRAWDEGKQKMIYSGYYDIEEKIFHREVLDKHYMRKYRGYGIQLTIFEDLKKYGNRFVYLYSPQGIWMSPFSRWLELGESGDEGHGEQIFLPAEEPCMRLGKE